MAAWFQRIATDDSKTIDRDRAATGEYVNAQARNRGLHPFRVRGTAKVRCVLLFHALAHNLLRTFALAPELLGLGKPLPVTQEMAA